MKRLAIVLVTTIGCTTSSNSTTPDEKKKTEAAATSKPAAKDTPPAKEAPSSSAYAELLDAYVKGGLIDYKALAENDRAKLDGVIATIATAKLPEDRDDKLGFYFDAYNAIVIHAVLTNDRPRSVLDVKGFFDKAEHTVAGQKVTLDALEKKVINPFAKDPRTHFVLVCGAVGCPIIEGTPFADSNVDERMDRATRRYLASSTGAKVSDGKLELSMIFNWYKADFGGEDGVHTFVKKHLAEDARKKLGDKPTVAFIDYNWTLNQQ